ncbi:MAG: MBL fold metallo-hydrolase RNA specificity domain-containing protein [Saccharofermentanales bacterium]|jgi:metallo-beta-lactamase family protein
MKITFLGAAEAVTGSCFLVETNHTRFLVDCGLHQGSPEEDRLNRARFPFDIDHIDFMLLTHAHIDHSGRIPKLYVDGYRKPIYMTKPTAELCGIMLPDSGYIQEMEAEWRNRKNNRAGRPKEDALYTMDDALKCLEIFQPVRYDEPFQPAKDVRVIMRDAGHILGSAILEIWVDEPEAGEAKATKLVFTGDLGNKGVPIMRDPTIIDGCDYLVAESTYGDRDHVETGNDVERFVRIINETIARGGNVIIPSFAVGRTQEVIYELNRQIDIYKDQLVPFMETPVYVDSPLAVSATKIFRQNTDCYDDEARRYVENGDHPLDFPNLYFTASVEESKQLNIDPESKIIISASGMCDAGRIKHHLKHNLWRPESTVLFVGYQAKGTLGRRILDGAKKVRIFQEDIAVRARIEYFQGFSGHADREGMLEWIGAMRKKPKLIILVHGEPDVLPKFSQTMEDRLHIQTQIAKLGQSIDLGAYVSRSRLAELVLTENALKRRIVSVTARLDELQAELNLLAEQSKAAIHRSKTGTERDEILAKFKDQVQKKTEEILANVR